MNDHIKSIVSEIARIGGELKPLVEKSQAGTLTADEDRRFDELVGQLNAAKADKIKAEERAAAASEIITLNREYNAPRDIVHTEAKSESLTIGQQFVQSAEFKNRDSKEQTREAFKVGSMYPEYNQYAPEGQKAVIGTGASTNFVAPQFVNGIYRPTDKTLVMRDVLLNMQTNSNSLVVMQESGFTNSAAETAEATLVSNGAKPESAITFTEATFPVRTIAHWVPITRQVLEDSALVQSYVDQRLRYGLKLRENGQILNGNGTAPNIRGILQTSGIQNLDQTYFTGAAVKNAGTDNENLNRIRRAITVIANTGQAQATFVVLNPADAETIDTIADANRQYLIGGPLAGMQRTLWGLRVVESSDMAAGSALVGDGSMAAVVDRSDAQVLIADQHDDFFTRNLLVLLAEERIALPVFRPAAFAFVDLT